MGQFSKLITTATLWAVMVMTAGCSGIDPYDPPDYREEAPVQGLLTGEEGEFVIYRKSDESETASEPTNKREQE